MKAPHYHILAITMLCCRCVSAQSPDEFSAMTDQQLRHKQEILAIAMEQTQIQLDAAIADLADIEKRRREANDTRFQTERLSQGAKEAAKIALKGMQSRNPVSRMKAILRSFFKLGNTYMDSVEAISNDLAEQRDAAKSRIEREKDHLIKLDLLTEQAEKEILLRESRSREVAEEKAAMERLAMSRSRVGSVLGRLVNEQAREEMRGQHERRQMASIPSLDTQRAILEIRTSAPGHSVPEVPPGTPRISPQPPPIPPAPLIAPSHQLLQPMSPPSITIP